MKETTKLLVLLMISITSIFMGDFFITDHNDDIKREFEEWKIKFGKQFSTIEESIYRYQIFRGNRKKVYEHNQLAKSGKSKYFMALNEFAATTSQQIKHQYGHISKQTRQSLLTNITTKCSGSIQDTPDPPQEVNWIGKAVTTDVRLEGKCPANWAFSSVAAVEGIYAIKFQKLIKLSDQQIIDCSGDYGNQGCKGGFMDQAYWYMIDQGVATESSYPYDDNKTIKCTYSPTKKAVSVGRCANVPSGSYEKMMSAVVQQPVSVAIASENFVTYSGGIFDGDCNDEIDRGMLLVGYGKADDGTKYWILKNTLGIGWGDKGFMKLKRTQGDGSGMCGILLAGSVPQNVE